ncbi:MAG: type II toxin-antitoxin system VapC family toxin [Candidatus Hydrogenedentota bacterium]
MNLVDSSGWLEFFANGPNAHFFGEPLKSADIPLLVPTICLYEVFKQILRRYGRREAMEKATAMRQGIVVPLHDELAINAAVISHDKKLPMADSVILATAQHYAATLWTQDADFENIDGVRYIKKP